MSTSDDYRARVIALGRRHAEAEREGDETGMTTAEQELDAIDREIPFDAALRAIFDAGRAAAGA